MKKKVILIILSVFSCVFCFAQGEYQHIFDTVNGGEKYYVKTDFEDIDSIDSWTYDFDASYRGTERDFIIPVGYIKFYRESSVDDRESLEIYGGDWTPNIEFIIYNKKEYDYCKDKSKEIRKFSSCEAPDIGGDMMVIGNYIFLNKNVCIECKTYKDGRDYCRPIINHIFSNIDNSKINTLESIINQLELKRKN